MWEDPFQGLKRNNCPLRWLHQVKLCFRMGEVKIFRVSRSEGDGGQGVPHQQSVERRWPEDCILGKGVSARVMVGALSLSLCRPSSVANWRPKGTSCWVRSFRWFLKTMPSSEGQLCCQQKWNTYSLSNYTPIFCDEINSNMQQKSLNIFRFQMTFGFSFSTNFSHIIFTRNCNLASK